MEKKKVSHNIVQYYFSCPEEGLIITGREILKDKEVSGLTPVAENEGRKVYRTIFRGQEFYFKIYPYQEVIRRVKDIFRWQPAVRALKKARILRKRGINTVKPASALVAGSYPWKKKSLLITEGFSGKNLRDFLVEENFSRSEKRKIISGVAHMWAKLFKNKVYPGDPNLTNILICREKDEIILSLVDLDGVKVLPFIPWKKVISNLVKFNAHTYSNMDVGRKPATEITDRDRLLFLEKFLDFLEVDKDKYLLAEYLQERTVNRLNNWGKGDLIRARK